MDSGTQLLCSAGVSYQTGLQAGCSALQLFSAICQLCNTCGEGCFFLIQLTDSRIQMFCSCIYLIDTGI